MKIKQDDYATIAAHVNNVRVAIDNAYKTHPQQKSLWLKIARNQTTTIQQYLDDALEYREEELLGNQANKDKRMERKT